MSLLSLGEFDILHLFQSLIFYFFDYFDAMTCGIKFGPFLYARSVDLCLNICECKEVQNVENQDDTREDVANLDHALVRCRLFFILEHCLSENSIGAKFFISKCQYFDSINEKMSEKLRIHYEETQQETNRAQQAHADKYIKGFAMSLFHLFV